MSVYCSICVLLMWLFQFCSNSRHFPEMFLQHKRLLVAENFKSGQVKLATARSLLKIDVNKTRRVYDYLAEQGLITKDTDSVKRKKHNNCDVVYTS